MSPSPLKTLPGHPGKRNPDGWQLQISRKKFLRKKILISVMTVSKEKDLSEQRIFEVAQSPLRQPVARGTIWELDRIWWGVYSYPKIIKWCKQTILNAYMVIVFTNKTKRCVLFTCPWSGVVTPNGIAIDISVRLDMSIIIAIHLQDKK